MKSLVGYAGEPAFAVPGTPDSYQQVGLTKREYLAALALQGYLAGDPNVDYEEAAKFAVEHADALLARLLEVDPPESEDDLSDEEA